MADFEIIAMGGGAIWERAFNAVAMVMGASAYQSLILVATLSGFSVMGWMLATGKSDLKTAIRWFCGIVIVMDLMIVPKVTIHIRDEVASSTGNGTQIYSVANVPLSLAIIAEISTQVSFALTQMFETAFSTDGSSAEMTNVSNLSGTGLMFAARLVNSTKHLTIINPELSDNIKHYVMQCVIPEIVHNNLTVKELVQSPNVWTLFIDTGSPARRFTYIKNDSQVLALCNDEKAIVDMSNALSLEVNGAPSQLSRLLGLPYKKDNEAALFFLRVRGVWASGAGLWVLGIEGLFTWENKKMSWAPVNCPGKCAAPSFVVIAGTPGTHVRQTTPRARNCLLQDQQKGPLQLALMSYMSCLTD